jgi:site-specific DNA-cytosine methylase
VSERRALDLFAGTRSATKFFAASARWKVDYVELNDGADIRSFHPSQRYDFVWSSPPCPEYSQGGKNRTWQGKYLANRELWLEGLRVIWEARPRFWVVENVKGAQQVWGRAPYHYGAFFLWGYFPKLKAHVPWTESLKGIRFVGSDHRTSSERAMIPEALAGDVFRAVEKALDSPGYKPGDRNFAAERARARGRMAVGDPPSGRQPPSPQLQGATENSPPVEAVA